MARAWCYWRGILELQLAPGITQLELVFLVTAQTGDKDFPDPAQGPGPHGMTQAVPLVEITHYTGTLGIGRPGGKAHTANPLVLAAMGSQNAIDMFVLALGEQVQIQIAYGGAEAVGVLSLLPLTLPRTPAQLIVRRTFGCCFVNKEIAVWQALHGAALPANHHLSLCGPGQ